MTYESLKARVGITPPHARANVSLQKDFANKNTLPQIGTSTAEAATDG